MRTLELNKTVLYVSNPTGLTYPKDSDGNYTGEVIKTYGTPTQISLALYPSSGELIERLFGKDYSCDMIAVTNDIVLTKDSLLFLSQPAQDADYFLTYNYNVDVILHSLNTYQYGLKVRT